MSRLLHLFIPVLIMGFAFQVKAQHPVRKGNTTYYPSSRKRNTNDRGECPRIYLGLNMGINNQNGLVGISLDVPVVKQLSAGAGIGRSTWGWKYFGEGRFYFGECHRGWAIGTGITHNTGLKDFETTLSTTNAGDAVVRLDFEPKTNVFIAGYRFWNIGHKRNRVYVELGYSIPLEETEYRVKTNHILTTESNDAIRALAPGGVLVAGGFYFSMSEGRR